MNDVTAAIVFTVVDVILIIGILLDVGPFKPVRAALESCWRSLRALLHDVIHRQRPARRKPYLSADTVEALEIECYVGPYAEPFRAESLKAREAAKRKRDSVRVIEPCERGDETAHMLAMNGRCVLCGTSPPRTPEYTPVKLDGDTMADCLGDPNRDHHQWRTFRDLEGFHTKCLRCGTGGCSHPRTARESDRPGEWTTVCLDCGETFPGTLTRLPNPGRQERR